MAYGGKDFELNVKDSWEDSETDCSLIRLYDTTNGFRGIANMCDFVMGTNSGTILLECKTTKETAFPLTSLTETQYEKMLEMSTRTTNTHGGVLIYFREYGEVWYYPIEDIQEAKEVGRKSINPKKHAYGKEIQIKKKRVNVSINFEDLLNTFDSYYGGA